MNRIYLKCKILYCHFWSIWCILVVYDGIYFIDGKKSYWPNFFCMLYICKFIF